MNIREIMLKTIEHSNQYVAETRWIKCRTCGEVIDAEEPGANRFHVIVIYDPKTQQTSVSNVLCGPCRDDTKTEDLNASS